MDKIIMDQIYVVLHQMVAKNCLEQCVEFLSEEQMDKIGVMVSSNDIETLSMANTILIKLYQEHYHTEINQLEMHELIEKYRPNGKI